LRCTKGHIFRNVVFNVGWLPVIPPETVPAPNTSGTFSPRSALKEMMDTTPAPEREQPWMLKALCRDTSPANFFPSDGVGVEVAKRVCAECPVKAACLEYALEYRIDHGVWGGASERERRRILRARRQASSATA